MFTPVINVDLIIQASCICPVVPRNMLLSNHAVVIQAGKIFDLCPMAETQQYQAKETIHLHDHVLIPGLINLHTHAAMSLMRGLADDVPLMPWLQSHIWPAEAKFVSANFVRDGTLLACAEMLAGGITCFNDMYFFLGATAKAAETAGIRAHIGMTIIDVPTAWANSAELRTFLVIACMDTSWLIDGSVMPPP